MEMGRIPTFLPPNQLYHMSQPVEKIAEEIVALYDRFGNEDYIGEPVSQLEHMSQSAQLAQREGYDSEVVLAAFFHDIGHICVQRDKQDSMGGFGVKRHEQIGADFLRSKGFPEKMARLVENHVQAKRYLTFKDAAYFHSLSEASKKTLEFQGGRMNQEEAMAFENDPLFELSIRMRRWDELAKEVNIPVINLEEIKTLIKKTLSDQAFI
jgi:2-amino-1-hydroxyethylphosphonate dioxygenase (glycine-forming)